MFHMIHIDIPLNRCACWLHHHVLQATFTYIPMIPNVIQSQWKKKTSFFLLQSPEYTSSSHEFINPT